jgi:hypothetical protein
MPPLATPVAPAMLPPNFGSSHVKPEGVEADRLPQERIEAVIGCHAPAVLLMEACNRNGWDRSLRPPPTADLTNQREAVFFRHRKVGDEQIEAGVAQVGERNVRVTRHVGFSATRPEKGVEKLKVVVVVVNDENALPGQVGR